jgi:hypothetical protein
MLVPLPQNPTSSLISFLTTQDSSIISIISVQIATTHHLHVSLYQRQTDGALM